MSQLENLIDVLKERKLTRSELSNYLGIPDRQARKFIEKLRKQGYLIVNDGLGEGYYIPKTKEEASQFLAEYYLHFKSMSVTLGIMLEEFERLPNG